MGWLNRKRNTLEKVNNDRVKVIVGIKGKDQQTLKLREPYMHEVTKFIEDAISHCADTYLSSTEELEKVAARGKVDVKDIRLITPMMKPVCNLIATMADREDLKDKLDEMVTVSQFAECFNAALYLMDIEKMIPNFTGALTKIQKTVSKTKKTS